MKIEKIDKWLDDKYGISYTELVKIKEYLVEERDMYKVSFETMSKNYFEEKSKNEKAIEYIENNYQYDDNIDDCWVTTNNLLNILRGNDNE